MGRHCKGFARTNWRTCQGKIRQRPGRQIEKDLLDRRGGQNSIRTPTNSGQQVVRDPQAFAGKVGQFHQESIPQQTECPPTPIEARVVQKERRKIISIAN